jgi:hypothetical protein
MSDTVIDDMASASRSRADTWGWRTLLVLSALLVLNGAVAMFLVEDLVEQDYGVPLIELETTYPSVADGALRRMQSTAIWWMAFGAMSLGVAVAGLRNGSRWAWYVSWVLAFALTAFGIHAVTGGETVFGVGLLAGAGVAVLGLMLARRGLVRSASS